MSKMYLLGLCFALMLSVTGCAANQDFKEIQLQPIQNTKEESSAQQPELTEQKVSQEEQINQPEQKTQQQELPVQQPNLTEQETPPLQDEIPDDTAQDTENFWGGG